VVDAMIAAADEPSPSIRLTLGSIAYESIRSALRERVAMLEAGKEITLSADRIGDPEMAMTTDSGGLIRPQL
jgi:hypothetical protein